MAGRDQLAAYWILCGLKEFLLRADWSGRDQARLYLTIRTGQMLNMPGKEFIFTFTLSKHSLL